MSCRRYLELFKDIFTLADLICEVTGYASPLYHDPVLFFVHTICFRILLVVD